MKNIKNWKWLSLIAPLAILLYCITLRFNHSYYDINIVSFDFHGLIISPLFIGQFSTILAIIFSIAFFISILIQWQNLERKIIGPAYFILTGALGTLYSGNIITEWLFGEIMFIASLLMLWNTGIKLQQTIRYIIWHLFANSLILIYVTYNTNDASINQYIDNTHLNIITPLIFTNYCLLLGLLINLAIFPFSNWLTFTYNKIPTTTLIFFVAISTKVALFNLINSVPHLSIYIPIGLATCIYAGIMAILSKEAKEMLIYGIIISIGTCITTIGLESIEIAISLAITHTLMLIIWYSLLIISSNHVAKPNISNATSKIILIFAIMTAIAEAIGMVFTNSFATELIIADKLEQHYYVMKYLFILIQMMAIIIYTIKIPFSILPQLRNKFFKTSQIIALTIPTLLICSINIFPNFYQNLLGNNIDIIESSWSQIFYHLTIIVTSILLGLIGIKIYRFLISSGYYKKIKDYNMLQTIKYKASTITSHLISHISKFFKSLAISNRNTRRWCSKYLPNYYKLLPAIGHMNTGFLLIFFLIITCIMIITVDYL